MGSSVEWVLTSSKIGVPACELQIRAPDFRAGLDPETCQKPLQVKRECVTKQGSVLDMGPELAEIKATFREVSLTMIMMMNITRSRSCVTIKID